MALRDDIHQEIVESNKRGSSPWAVTDRILDLIRQQRDEIRDTLFQQPRGMFKHLESGIAADAVIALLCGEDTDG